MRVNSTLAAIALFFASAVAHGQQLYVDDKLVLNVYAEVDQGGGRVDTIETGDVVEEIERVDKFVRVRLSNGREGWVGSSYLKSQPPAIVRLKELQAGQPVSAPAGDSAQTKKLTDDVARLQKQNASLSAELTELKKKPAASSPLAAPAVNSTATSAPEPVSEPERTEPAPVVVVQRSYWWAWLLAVLAAGGGGYYVGYQTLGRRVRERFGGVKVY